MVCGGWVRSLQKYGSPDVVLENDGDEISKYCKNYDSVRCRNVFLEEEYVPVCLRVCAIGLALLLSPRVVCPFAAG